jgi:hypothetical protein
LPRAFASALLALALATTVAGCKSEAGADGQPGAPAPTTGTIAGTVTDATKGDGIQGVTVTAKDFGGVALATAPTTSAGAYTLANVPIGTVQVTFTKTYYTSPAPITVGTIGGGTVTINASLSEAGGTGGGGPSVSIAAATQGVGYGAVVNVTASATDPNGDPLTYTWSDGTAPKFAGVTVTKDAADQTKATVQMPTMANAFLPRLDTANNIDIPGYTLEDRFGIVPIVHDVRGRVTVSVTVADGRGQSVTKSVSIDAASVNTGMPSIPTGTRVYLNAGHDDPNAWVLTAKPAASTAVLENDGTRTPSFVADADGTYTLTEGSNTLTIKAGTFLGALDGSSSGLAANTNCTGCHNGTDAPDQFTPWLQTAHASIFKEGIDGGSGTSSGSCLECHTVGYDLAAASDGFDDKAASLGWTFPTTRTSGNWEGLNAGLKQLANIQCENCHGPQGANHMQTTTAKAFKSPRISYSAELCGNCHGRTSHHRYSEWATLGSDGIGHSNRGSASIGASASGLSGSCGRCHVAQGYPMYVDQLKGVTPGGIGSLLGTATKPLTDVTTANAEPVTCVACHDPHDATNPNQLRVYGNTPLLPSGFSVYGAGKGALCVTCHNSRNGAQSGSTALTYLHEAGETYTPPGGSAGDPTGYNAPHQAAQSDVFFGRNAYFMAGQLPMISRHAAVEDTCVGCHMKLNPKTLLSHGAPAAKTHLFRIEEADFGTFCANCHSSAVNGEAIQGQVEAQLASLASKIGAAVKTKTTATSGGVFTVRAYDETSDGYSATCTGSGCVASSNVTIDTTANAIVSVGIEEIHGQVGFVFHLTNDLTWTTTGGVSVTSKDIAVQMGDVRDSAGGNLTTNRVYGLGSNTLRAAWNYFLVHGDGTEGIHNPSFVFGVLAATMAQDVTN